MESEWEGIKAALPEKLLLEEEAAKQAAVEVPENQLVVEVPEKQVAVEVPEVQAGGRHRLRPY